MSPCPEQLPGPEEPVLSAAERTALRISDEFDELSSLLEVMNPWTKRNEPARFLFPGSSVHWTVIRGQAESTYREDRQTSSRIRQAYIALALANSDRAGPTLQLILTDECILGEQRDQKIRLVVEDTVGPGETIRREILYPDDHVDHTDPRHLERRQFLLEILTSVRSYGQSITVRDRPQKPDSQPKEDQLDYTDIPPEDEGHDGYVT